MPRTPTTRSPGQPRRTDYPTKIGPVRCTRETWQLLDEAVALVKPAGVTQRDIVEAGIAAEARRIIQAQTGGTNGSSSTQEGAAG